MQRLILASSCQAAMEQRRHILASSIPTQIGIAWSRRWTSRGRQRQEDISATVVHVERDGRQLWAECRQALRQAGTYTITRGVQELRIDEGNDAAVQEPLDFHDVDDDDDCNSDDLLEIRLLGRKVRNGGTIAKKGSTLRNRRNKKMDDDTDRSDGEGTQNFWSVRDTIALVKAKRDQDLYFAGMGHNFGRMKTREWKCKDVWSRLQKTDVTRKVVDCRKKCDNLIQQFKKVHKFQHLTSDLYRLLTADISRVLAGDFFSVVEDHRCSSSRLLVAWRFGPVTLLAFAPRCSVDTSMFSETEDFGSIHGGALSPYHRGSVLPCGGSASPLFSSSRHRAVSPGSSSSPHEGNDDDVFTTEEEAPEETVAVVRESGRLRSSDQSVARRLLTPPPEAQHVRARETRSENEAVADVGGDDEEPLERRRQCNVTQATIATAVRARGGTDERPPQGGLPATPSQARPPNTADEGGSIERGEVGGSPGRRPRSWGRGGRCCRYGNFRQCGTRVEAVSYTHLVADAHAVGGKAVAAAGAGTSGNVAPVPRAREELPVVEREVARGAKDLIDHARLDLQALVVPRSVVMPESCTKLTRIVDPAQLQQVISHVAAVENIALHVLHGWVFKFGNRPRGYNLVFQYTLESVATNISRAMWYGEQWSKVVSAVVCTHTIDLSMDLTLWFAGANIEDRPEDDDLAAYQESTIICIGHAFRGVVRMGANVDGGSNDCLSRVADCFKLLAASMWLTCMVGDNLRSHYETFYFTKLVVKPTLIASMHRSFEHRRSVIRATNVVTEKLGKANATLGEYPKYISEWASCAIVFWARCEHNKAGGREKAGLVGFGPPGGGQRQRWKRRRVWGGGALLVRCTAREREVEGWEGGAGAPRFVAVRTDVGSRDGLVAGWVRVQCFAHVSRRATF
ncbi:hypothetical protein CBR_g37516 [Chara braunii]|uniref:Myb-like domain-containing protein n=1 Tax=Chara braunii TaxID=69332 RepID=A0A388LNA0_CHABU|nr:hypothetical protein CBR_g37516 [Chara braunii]|eukprot:GBG83715.1 hypothetical protein CBR_g37516 [Chara braunii]